MLISVLLANSGTCLIGKVIALDGTHFIVENQGSFLLSETIFWQESVVECKLSSAEKRKVD